MATKPKFPFVRRLTKAATNGTDVQAIKRALSRAGFMDWAKFDNAYNAKAANAVHAFQKAKGLTVGVYEEKTHARLVATKSVPDTTNPGLAFDEYAGELLWAEYEKRNEDPALKKAQALLDICRKYTGSYGWGGGHGVPLSRVRFSDDLDCSGSSCHALWSVDLYHDDYATNSTGMESYGDAGRGRYVTIHANWEHVWIEFTLPAFKGRFDTSPHGCGSRGPRVRTCPRFASTFIARHPKGL